MASEITSHLITDSASSEQMLQGTFQHPSYQLKAASLLPQHVIRYSKHPLPLPPYQCS